MTGNISCDLWIVTQTVRTIPTQLAHLFLCSGATQSLSPLARSLTPSIILSVYTQSLAHVAFVYLSSLTDFL